MRTAYLDLPCGLSGDMLLAAILDAGVEPEDLRATLAGLAPGEWELHAERVVKNGVTACCVRVTPSEARAGDVEAPSVGHKGEDASDHPHYHGHDEDHSHSHDHHHGDHAGHLPHHALEAEHQREEAHHHFDHGRSYPDLRRCLEEAGLGDRVRTSSLAMLAALAQAEAKVHGVPVEDVHFHEVGGLDTVVDLAGAVAGLELLGVERVVATAIPWSHGYVDTSHGRLPVPAPATAVLLLGLPVRGVDIEGETVTPTGAVLARHLVGAWGPMPSITIEALGVGAGTADFSPVPNIVRLFVGRETGHETRETVMIADSVALVAANIDDMEPELFEPAMEAAFDAGAVDVWLVPIYMKHNRPAVQFNALAAVADVRPVAEAILHNTSTLGVRVTTAERRCLPREKVHVDTPFGQISVKVARLGSDVVSAQPEYRECAEAAASRGATVREVYAAAQAAAYVLFRARPVAET